MTDEPLFNIVSHARGGPGYRHSLSMGQIQQIRRTVGRTPEVMVNAALGVRRASRTDLPAGLGMRRITRHERNADGLVVVQRVLWGCETLR
jgi:hypothetical protein